MEKRNKAPLLEEGLITAMQAIDQQVARAMERSPAQREEMGVQKWGPYSQKIEQVCGLILDTLEDERITLDSVLVLSQSLAKALKMVIEDLGADGLGEVRSDYCKTALEDIERDALSGLRHLTDPGNAGFLT